MDDGEFDHGGGGGGGGSSAAAAAAAVAAMDDDWRQKRPAMRASCCILEGMEWTGIVEVGRPLVHGWSG